MWHDRLVAWGGIAHRLLLALVHKLVPHVSPRAESVDRSLITVSSDEIAKPIFLTVIIPCFNEESTISRAVESALQGRNVEVIVCDGGSSDKSIASIQPMIDAGRVRLVSGGRSRAQSQTLGAQLPSMCPAQSASVLLFLHADSYLPPGYDDLIQDALRDKQRHCCAGAFSFRIDRVAGELSAGLRLIEWGTNQRASRWSLPYGDQAVFVRRSVFESLGGFKDVPLLEDVELVVSIRNRGGHLWVLDAPVVTSGRRWRLFGAVKNTLMNQVVLIGWRLGVPHSELVKWYYGMASAKDY